ncbi:DUF421 domain-containing protein [Corticicoccus populi]|uniref:DUF421 domain-containing protein n=1 Tax=Corticicoccus populi TaxID=1812821 RepID=A0ABW5WW31_9STAP
MMEYALKLTVGLIGVMLVLRFMGKKELAQITPLDFVYALILGSIVEESLFDPSVDVYEIIFALLYWAVLIYLIEKFALKSRRFRRLTKGQPVILINDGELDSKVMRKNHMEVDEVRSLLRRHNVFTLREVRYALLEENGQLSILKYASEDPPTRGETMKQFPENVRSHLFIDDGKVEHETLEQCGYDENWLKEHLKHETGYEINDIFFAEWNKNDGFFVQEKQTDNGSGNLNHN